MDADMKMMNETGHVQITWDLSFVHAALQALSVIVVSELGDKTFFIAAILAMQHSRVSVIFGAMIANILMFILTVAIGWMMTIIPKAYIQFMSSFFFVIFGLQMIKEGQRMSPNKAAKELEEAKEEIKKKESKSTGNKSPVSNKQSMQWSLVTSSVVVKSFSLTFLAEWGDRSQVTTVLLGASEDLAGVIFGGLVGHTICTGFAAVSGHYVAKKVSLGTVHTMGGVLFLVFGAAALWGDFD